MRFSTKPAFAELISAKSYLENGSMNLPQNNEIETSPMKRWSMKLGTIGTALALAACSSSTDVGVTRLISAEEEALRVFAVDEATVQNFSQVLGRGDLMVAREVGEAARRENFDGTSELVDGDIRLQRVGDDLIVTVTFVGEDTPTVLTIPNAVSLAENSYTFDGADRFFDIYLSGSLTFAQLLDETRDSDGLFRIGIYTDTDANGYGASFRGIIGTEATDQQIADMISVGTTVEYDVGFGSMSIRRQGAEWDEFNANVYGDMTMTADFADSSVSGEMVDPTYEERMGDTEIRNEIIVGAITFDDAAIIDNAFVGTVSTDDTFATNDATVAGIVDGLNYGGAFYGPDAGVIGGSIGGTTTSGGEDYLTIGNFEVYTP